MDIKEEGELSDSSDDNKACIVSSVDRSEAVYPLINDKHVADMYIKNVAKKQRTNDKKLVSNKKHKANRYEYSKDEKRARYHHEIINRRCHLLSSTDSHSRIL